MCFWLSTRTIKLGMSTICLPTLLTSGTHPLSLCQVSEALARVDGQGVRGGLHVTLMTSYGVKPTLHPWHPFVGRGKPVRRGSRGLEPIYNRWRLQTGAHWKPNGHEVQGNVKSMWS